MFKNLTTIIAGTLVAMGMGPAFAQSNNVPMDLDTVIEILDTLQGASGDLQNAVDDLQNAIDDLQNSADDSQSLLEPKTIFVSSTLQTADLGGLTGADAICQGLADAPGSIVPEGEYVALLSTDEVGAASRITPSSGPYVRPDGVPVADSFAALFSTRPLNTDRDLLSRVRGDELGNLFGSEVVWTNSTANGLQASSTCVNWNSAEDADGPTFTGETNELDADWIDSSPLDCDQLARLYCVLR